MKRRSFINTLGAAAVGSASLATRDEAQSRKSGAAGDAKSKSPAGGGVSVPSLMRKPDRVMVETEASHIRLERSRDGWGSTDLEVTTDVREHRGQSALAVALSAPKSKPLRVHLRWNGAFPLGWRYLGDHWERSYGDLEWRALVGERAMPWYVLASNGKAMHGYGVKTGAAAIAWWQVDAGGISLWLDVRNGGSGVQLGERRLLVAEIVERHAHVVESPMTAARAFCRVMCETPRLPQHPVYGSNNWYYAYGQNMSAVATLHDADLMAELSPAGTNRPFVVIDMGWSEAPEGAGPVSHLHKGFTDMSELAAAMKRASVRPGIWTRPLLTSERIAEAWRLPAIAGRPAGPMSVIDPTIPEASAYIADSIRTLSKWGFELIKHDYSTYDLWGRWGFAMGTELTDGGWHFNDRSRTTAEIIGALYRTIRDAAGESLLIGCNTIGHLGAGLFELQRIGDDTSGREWARTRKMGVNTLAFRMVQHNTFFSADADCVPVTADIPWSLTRQWLDLIARSGTALFVSPDPAFVRAEHKPALRAALSAAARPVTPGEPLDWFDTTTPQSWRLGSQITRYDWYNLE